MKLQYLSLAWIFIFSISNLNAQDSNDSLNNRIFQLGEVKIIKNIIYEPELSLSKEKIENFDLPDVATALSEIPGISFNLNGPRNEKMIYVRGFDTRQVPVLIDGIPVYISYDGNIDLSRFSTWDFQKISVSHGPSSLLYGPNIMGGAINLVTRKPVNPFEFNGEAGIKLSNSGYNGHFENVRLGSNFGKFFYQLSLTNRDYNDWALSNNYERRDSQPAGERLNSFESDRSFAFRFGFLPSEGNEYVLSYQRQDGNKGIPEYTGDFQNRRYWQMPEWNKESLYFIIRNRITNHSYVKARLYYDSFYNLLESYDDSTYSSQTFRYAFSSVYDDHSLGSSVEYHNSSVKNNNLAIALHFKRDVHMEQGAEESPFLNFLDHTYSLALEDVISISPGLDLTGGISWNFRKNMMAQEFVIGDSIVSMENASDNAINYRISLSYNALQKHRFWTGASANSRFATLKERYSYRLGRSLPNPDLGSERAFHFVSGYEYKSDLLDLYTELFYIRGKDKIAYVNVNPETLQFRNVDNTISYGMDISISVKPWRIFHTNLNYSYLSINDPDNSEFRFINLPDHSLRFTTEFHISKNIYSNLVYEYTSRKDSYSDGSYQTDGYGLVHANLRIDLPASFSVSLSAKNLLDKAYFYSEGYPAEGRTLRTSLRMNF